jgi:hypothetical protein
MSDDERPQEQSFIDRIVELKHESPFEKFKATMTSGSSYTIEHPDLVALGAARMMNCIAKSDRVIEMRWNQMSEIQTTGEFVIDPQS